MSAFTPGTSVSAPRTVVITRPAAQAEGLAAPLRAAGRPVLVFPAIAIGPCADAAPLIAALAALESYRLVVFVSPNAIEQAWPYLGRPWPTGVALAVVGPGSRDALSAHGIVAPPHEILMPALVAEAAKQRYDSEALYARLEGLHLAGQRVLIVKGNGGRPWLAEQLAGAGARVDLVESYRRDVPRADARQRAALLGLIDADAAADIVVTSSEGLENLDVQMADLAGPRAVAWLRRQRLLVPHARIAENATASGYANVVLTAPGDANILRTLECNGF